jgi:hypothetical protein
MGGGILNEGTLHVQNSSTIRGSGAGNEATNVGGGIMNYDTLNVQNASTIGGTGAGNHAALGGGIYNHEGIATVTGSRILRNTANNGSGVYSRTSYVWATTVTGSCIVGNNATSFWNELAVMQKATGNWWGAATGPNTPGADTVSDYVDYGSYLTEPILGCGFYVFLPVVLRASQ